MNEYHLTLQSTLLEADIAGLYWAFAFGPWMWKVLCGDDNPNSEALRTPCIHIENYTKRYNNLYAYQAAWLLARGNPPIGMTISHQCTRMTRGEKGKKGKKEGKKFRISSCVNVLHMRCEPAQWNTARNGDQRALRDFKRDNLRNLKGFKGPKFLEHTDDHDTDDSSFINCGSGRRISDGFFVFKPRPGRNMIIQSPKITWHGSTFNQLTPGIWSKYNENAMTSTHVFGL